MEFYYQVRIGDSEGPLAYDTASLLEALEVAQRAAEREDYPYTVLIEQWQGLELRGVDELIAYGVRQEVA